jgi:hypothetical protein
MTTRSFSPDTLMVLASLRANTEGCTLVKDGVEFHSVYLDNARHPGMRPHQFAGHLSVLQKAGLYIPEGDDCFGLVARAECAS